jgi:hypothetical protein
MDEMSEFDPTELKRILDELFLRVTTMPQFGYGDPGPHLDELVSGGQLSGPEADALRGLVAKGHGPHKIPAATAVKEVDAILGDGTVQGPLALTILKTIKFAAEQEVAAHQAGTVHENLLSKPNVDWGAAADGAVDGGAGGAAAGAVIGATVGALLGPEGAAVGAVVCAIGLGLQGAIMGGVIDGLGHGSSGKK